jgi:transposase-like protein
MESVQKLGSLNKAIAERETESRAKKQDILGLSKQEAEQRAVLRALDDQITVRRQKIAEYDKKIESKIRELEWCNETMEKNKWQYQFFELLISMLLKSPSATEPLAAIGLKIQELGKKGWTHSMELTSEQRRAAFITLVMGTYLHSIHCGKCGASFIVNKPSNAYSSYRSSYYCPVCDLSSYTKPDETFFNLMVSPELAQTKFRYV